MKRIQMDKGNSLIFIFPRNLITFNWNWSRSKHQIQSAKIVKNRALTDIIYVTNGSNEWMGPLACLSPSSVLIVDKVRLLPLTSVWSGSPIKKSLTKVKHCSYFQLLLVIRWTDVKLSSNCYSVFKPKWQRRHQVLFWKKQKFQLLFKLF